MSSGKLRRTSLRTRLRRTAGAMSLGCVSAVVGADTFFAERVQPIFKQACVGCHGPEKSRGGLRLHTFEDLVEGGDSGPAVAPGAAERSELFRRLTLPPDDDEAMPPEGKKRLTPGQTEILRRWIQAGASADLARDAIDVAGLLPAPVIAVAPDYRPFTAELARLEKQLHVRFVPVSEKVGDGLILRTISAADSVDDQALAALAPISALIVDAELARTRVTDAGLAALSQFTNLRRLDLAHTGVTSAGVAQLGKLERLETINLVGTRADNSAWETLRRLPALRRVHVFGTAMTP